MAHNHSLSEHLSEGIAFRTERAADRYSFIVSGLVRLLIGSYCHGHRTDYGQDPNHESRKDSQWLRLQNQREISRGSGSVGKEIQELNSREAFAGG